MSPSAFAGLFREYTLTFTTAANTSTTDAWDNPVPGDGQKVNVKAYLKPRAAGFGADPVLRQGPGQDALMVTLQGRLTDPVTLPDGIQPGSKSPLTFNGVKGVFTLEPSLPGVLAAVDEALGQRIIGAWRAT